MNEECKKCIEENGEPDDFFCSTECIGPDTPSIDLPIERFSEV